MIPRLLVAALLWLGMFAWSNVPPYRGNVLEQKRAFFVWHWKLFSRGGEGICDVRYYDRKHGNAPIERWKLLGFESAGDMPESLARTHKPNLIREYQRVCTAMRKAGDPAPEIEVEARCAEQGAWKTVEHRRRNVCGIKGSPRGKGKASGPAAVTADMKRRREVAGGDEP